MPDLLEMLDPKGLYRGGTVGKPHKNDLKLLLQEFEGLMGGVGNKQIAEVAPVTGEALSAQRLVEAMQNLPNAGNYINNGEFNSRAYGKAMQSHGGQIGLEAMGTLPLVGAMASIPLAMTKNARKGFNAGTFGQAGMVGYHGSPHHIKPDAEGVTKFDHSKMGSGEGAQAYGWGTYIAENPEVAGSYQKVLSGPFGNAQDYKNILNVMPEAKRSRDNARAILNHVSEAVENGDIKKVGDYISEYGVSPDLEDAYKAAAKEFDNTGHLYSVDLPDEKIAQMLDWDAPLSEQPDSVRAAFKSDKDAFENSTVGEGWGDLANEPNVYNPTGAELYHAMAEEVSGQPTGFMGSAGQQEASLKLKELGIPGIKYLDGSSRSAGEGTRNFVVFDENDMSILSRNGEKISQPLAMDEASRMQLIPEDKQKLIEAMN